jgi:ribosomal protein L31E
MADNKKVKQKEPKVVLEREYIVPLRSEWLKVAKHKRATRAVKELKRFLARHMKIYDRDLRKIKIENDLNNELRFRGMRKPCAKIKVKAIKLDNDTVRVEMVDIPEHIKFMRIREEKMNKKSSLEKTSEKEKKEDAKEEKKESKVEESKEEKAEDKHDAKEKEEASREEGLAISKEEAREQKHVSKIEKPTTQNIGYKRAQKGR